MEKIELPPQGNVPKEKSELLSTETQHDRLQIWPSQIVTTERYSNFGPFSWFQDIRNFSLWILAWWLFIHFVSFLSVPSLICILEFVTSFSSRSENPLYSGFYSCEKNRFSTGWRGADWRRKQLSLIKWWSAKYSLMWWRWWWRTLCSHCHLVSWNLTVIV